MYLVDKIERLVFYEQLTRIINIWEEMKANEDTLKPIVNKWGKRRKEITFFFYFVIRSSHDHIEKIFDVANDLSYFDDRRVALQLKANVYLSKYKSEKFDLFPCALDRKNKLKNKDDWAKELDEFFYLRMNKVINEK